MALIFVDGFPYATADLSTVWYVSTNGTVETANPRFSGGRWLQLSGGGYVFVRRAIAPLATICVQFGYKSITQSAVGTYIPILSLNDDGTSQVTLRDYNGVLKAHRGATLLGTASAPITQGGIWHQLEVKVTIHGSTGIFKVIQDGTTVIDLTSQNTKSTSNESCNFVEFGCSAISASGGVSTHAQGISDVIVMDTTGSYCNDLLGFRRVQLFVPTADGNYQDSTPSTGSDQYATVDEIGPSSSDYNTLDAVNETDSFAVDNLGTDQTVISAVVCAIFCKTTDGGKAELKGVARSNSVDGYGTTQTVPQTSSYIQSPIYVDPNTSAAWTKSGFDAAEFGYKRAS